MKAIDKLLRNWRATVALRAAGKPLANVYDIGCHDGYLLSRLRPVTERQDGLDPDANPAASQNSSITKGLFPADVSDAQRKGTYDAIFALAVFEHFSEEDLRASATVIAEMLSPQGRLIVTVPHPFVDRILDVLMAIRLIDGQHADEHHGFEPGQLDRYLSGPLRLVKRETFQLGLNNLFVFQRQPAPCS